MKSKHDVRVQQSRRRFLADTALGAAGLGLGASGGRRYGVCTGSGKVGEDD